MAKKNIKKQAGRDNNGENHGVTCAFLVEVKKIVGFFRKLKILCTEIWSCPNRASTRWAYTYSAGMSGNVQSSLQATDSGARYRRESSKRFIRKVPVACGVCFANPVGGPWGRPGTEISHQQQVPPKRSTTMFFKSGVFGPQDAL